MPGELPVANEVPFEELPLTGYVRIVSDIEADDALKGRGFKNGEFLEVRGGRVPPGAFMVDYWIKEKEYDTPARVIYFSAASVAGLPVDHKHPGYESVYPAIASTAFFSKKFTKHELLDITPLVKHRIRAEDAGTVPLQKAVEISSVPLFDSVGRITDERPRKFIWFGKSFRVK